MCRVVQLFRCQRRSYFARGCQYITSEEQKHSWSLSWQSSKHRRVTLPSRDLSSAEIIIRLFICPPGSSLSSSSSQSLPLFLPLSCYSALSSTVGLELRSHACCVSPYLTLSSPTPGDADSPEYVYWASHIHDTSSLPCPVLWLSSYDTKPTAGH
ncbi:hypothetical protein J6590_063056 [Homalodisca vitripennis]|nr:hypothetical protein J6590_063056 [Homalodisca vitripennis]